MTESIQFIDDNWVLKTKKFFLKLPFFFFPLALTAQAHLMAVDRATLNFRQDAAFMVLSLGPSSFVEIQLDDDGDGVISSAEFLNHQVQLQQVIAQKVQLKDDKGPIPLEGVFVSLEPSHDPSSAQPSIIVLGKYALRSGLKPTHWSIGLWPTESKGNPIEATLTSQSSEGVVLQNQSLTFTPSKNTHRLFPSLFHKVFDFAWLFCVLIFLISCVFLILRAKGRSVESTMAGH